MHAKLLNDKGERTYALVFDTGDEPVSLLTRFAAEHRLSAARLSAIGAFSELVAGGDIALADGKPKVHAHVVVGKRDGSAHGGHLLEARVRPTLEVVLTESPAHLVREHDPRSGLALIRIRG
jgi:hypothetical protein